MRTTDDLELVKLQPEDPARMLLEESGIRSEKRILITRVQLNTEHDTDKILTTRVRKQRVLAGARGSRAACRSHTLIFLERGKKSQRVDIPRQGICDCEVKLINA